MSQMLDTVLIGALALNAAPAARRLYESLGYFDAPSSMMYRVTPPSGRTPTGTGFSDTP